jgi:hypothetical protein
MKILAITVLPPAAGFIIAWTGRRLLGSDAVAFTAIMAMCAAVGVGFATSLLP